MYTHLILLDLIHVYVEHVPQIYTQVYIWTCRYCRGILYISYILDCYKKVSAKVKCDSE